MLGLTYVAHGIQRHKMQEIPAIRVPALGK